MRRIWTTAVIMSAVCSLAAGVPAAQKGARDSAPAAEKLGWRLGVQAWTFNRYTFFEAVDITAKLGLHYIEAYPGQRLCKDMPNARMIHTMSQDLQKLTLEKLRQAHVKLVNYGVVGLGKDEKQCRRVFEFAKRMGIETIVSEPPQDALPMIDKLCNEYGINVALHNHPKPSRYWNPDIVLKACRGRSKRIGACCDIGHWMRSGVNPLEALRKLRGRIICFHFKDLNKFGRGAHDVVWGTGQANVPALLTEIYRQGIKPVFSVEYEYHTPELIDNVRKSILFFNSVCEDLAKKQQAGQHRKAGR